jgi:hypothetical protein
VLLVAAGEEEDLLPNATLLPIWEQQATKEDFRYL